MSDDLATPDSRALIALGACLNDRTPPGVHLNGGDPLFLAVDAQPERPEGRGEESKLSENATLVVIEKRN